MTAERGFLIIALGYLLKGGSGFILLSSNDLGGLEFGAELGQFALVSPALLLLWLFLIDFKQRTDS